MTGGLTVFNNDNKIQITNDFQNLVLAKTEHVRVHPCEVVGSDIFEKSTPVNIPAGISLVAVELKDSLIAGRWDSNTGQYHLYASGTNPIETTCYLFSEQKQSPYRSNGGLQVFNEDGACVFDSTQKFMRVVGYRHGVSRWPLRNDSITEIDLPKSLGGRKFASVLPIEWNVYDYVNSSDVQWRAGCKIQDRRVICKDFIVEKRWSPDSAGSLEAYLSYMCMVIDVTGF